MDPFVPDFLSTLESLCQNEDTWKSRRWWFSKLEVFPLRISSTYPSESVGQQITSMIHHSHLQIVTVWASLDRVRGPRHNFFSWLFSIFQPFWNNFSIYLLSNFFFFNFRPIFFNFCLKTFVQLFLAAPDWGWVVKYWESEAQFSSSPSHLISSHITYMTAS